MKKIWNKIKLKWLKLKFYAHTYYTMGKRLLYFKYMQLKEYVIKHTTKDFVKLFCVYHLIIVGIIKLFKLIF